ncbi:MAG TPA: hypothetical protein VHL34_20665 [Rhizomicrobium sp.]|jgi:hypothetical protein|nr:hypothetical protein [Rhizomicrobium sp.]
MRALKHALVWIALWAFWVFISRGHHPTLFIDMVATAMLMLASAAAFYANIDVLVPRFWATGRRLAWGAAFVVLVAGLAVVTTLVIAAFYDAAWGPDPDRYSFGMNVAMESAWIAIHALGGAVLMRSMGRVARAS